ncbi:hypothetical protein [Thermogutta sp.]|uniref:hypothetical protein n=1 Tax=Thermogutta sp. TaxID=1962930 RepID=UPI003C7BC099
MTSIRRRTFAISLLTAVVAICLSGCRSAWFSPCGRYTACYRRNCLRLNCSSVRCANAALRPAGTSLGDQTADTMGGSTWAEHVFPESFRRALQSPGGKFYALPTRPVLEAPAPARTGPTDSSQGPVEPEPIPTPPPLPQSSAPMLAPQPPVASEWRDFSASPPSLAPPEREPPPPNQDSPTSAGGPPSSNRFPDSWLFALPADQRVAVRAQSQQVVLPDTPARNPSVLQRLLAR